jgi:hypothetical protein
MSILYSLLFTLSLAIPPAHPYYVSVTEIEHNQTAGSLEISVRLFTSDLEQALKNANPKTRIDLLTKGDQTPMEKILDAYIQRHMSFQADEKSMVLQFIGYESKDDCIYAYYDTPIGAKTQHLTIVNNLLFEYKKEQISIIHFTNGKKKKSIRLTNPEDTWRLSF